MQICSKQQYSPVRVLFSPKKTNKGISLLFSYPQLGVELCSRTSLNFVFGVVLGILFAAACLMLLLSSFLEERRRREARGAGFRNCVVLTTISFLSPSLSLSLSRSLSLSPSYFILSEDVMSWTFTICSMPSSPSCCRYTVMAS